MEFHKASAPEPSGTSQGICTGTLPPEPHQASSLPKPSGASQGLCTGTFRNLRRYLPRNPPEPSGTLRNPPEPSGTLRNPPEPSGTLRNPPEPHHASSPRPSKTSSGSCTRNFRNLTRYLHQNPLEPNQVSAPQLSGSSPSTCTGNFRNLTRYLHRNPPEPHRTLRSLSGYLHRNPPEPHEVSNLTRYRTSRGICTRTLRNLVRNLVLKLHRIAPELIWAKDPTAKFCCWGKIWKFYLLLNVQSSFSTLKGPYCSCSFQGLP